MLNDAKNVEQENDMTSLLDTKTNSTTNGSNLRQSSGDVIGLDSLWDIVLHVKDDDISNQASETLVSKSKRKRVMHRVYGKHCSLTFLYLLPLSNLLHCLCHVSPLILKHPNKSFFF